MSEIPNFVTIQKVKPKLSKENVRVTQLYGSMKAKNAIVLVKEIKEKKEQAALHKKETVGKKELEKQTFLLCKTKCVCGKKKCSAVGLKQCPTCFQVMKSICSKNKCRVDGVKPQMILPAAASKAKQQPKRLFSADNDDDSQVSSSESEEDSDNGEESE